MSVYKGNDGMCFAYFAACHYSFSLEQEESKCLVVCKCVCYVRTWILDMVWLTLGRACKVHRNAPCSTYTPEREP
jgi:hypothetical protein